MREGRILLTNAMWTSVSSILSFNPIGFFDSSSVYTLCAAARFEISRDAQVPPFPVRFHPRRVIPLCQMDSVAAEQQPQRRLIEAREVDNDGCSLDGITRLNAVIVALESGYRANRGIVLGATVAHLSRRACKVGAETAGLNDRDLDSERTHLFREYFRETLDAPFGGGIGRAPPLQLARLWRRTGRCNPPVDHA